MNRILRTVFFFMVMAVSSSAMAEVIKKISVHGNQRVEQSTIVEYLGMKVGDKYNPETKDKSVKSLYATSLFETINIKFHQGSLSVTVQETPFISKVVFTGNYKVKTNLLANVVSRRITNPNFWKL